MSNIFGGRNSFFNSLGRDINRTVTNPVQHINRVLGTKIPDKIKIAGTTIGVDPGKQLAATMTDIKKAGRQANTDWQNAGKGEVGKWASGLGQSMYNFGAAPVNIVTGKGTFETESQKWLGALHNFAGFGTSNYFGRSKGVQEFLRDENLSKNTLGLTKNWAGATHGASTLNQSGTLSNEDRVGMQQLGTKVAAVFAAIFGGIAGAGALGGGGGGGAAAGTGVGIGTGSTAAAGAGATAGGTSLSTYLGYAGAAGIGAQVLTGKKSAQQGIAEFYSGDQGTGSFLDSIGDFIGGDSAPGTPARAPAVGYGGGGGGYSSGSSEPAGDGLGGVIFISLAGVATYFILTRMEII